MSCHGKEPDDIEAGLNLTYRQGLLKGGISGIPAIEPGVSERSALISAIKRLDPDKAMPPKAAEKMSPEEIEYFIKWIDGGAPWPEEDRRDQILGDPRWKGKGKISLPIEGALTEGWSNRNYRLSDLWAYRPISEVEVPSGAHPVDYLLEGDIIESGLTKAPAASKQELARRLYFGLTGLPPTYQQLTEFVDSGDSNAYLGLVDHLLNDTAYGEQMARQWLDVVRYADSDGFSNDYIRPNAWRYRDYVIRSFNADKPYNQFIVEQIAGDEIDEDDPEMLIATGFLRMGPWEHTAMSVAKETRQIFLDDVVNSVGETFLSTPLMCAKCHDHKFDPIPATDYYSIQAVFATTQFADRPADFLAEENLTLMSDEKDRIAEWIIRTETDQAQITLKEEAAARKWYQEQSVPYRNKKERRSLGEEEQPPRYYGLTYGDLGYRKVLQKRRQTLDAEARRFEPLAFSVYNGPDRIVSSGRLVSMPSEFSDSLPRSFLLQAGSVFSPGEEVKPGVMQAIPLLQKHETGLTQSDLEMHITDRIDGRRLALAKWIAHPEHPLTARSIVNRVWQFHFGKGLTEDPNNFGSTSDRPQNIELLDFLARYLIKNQWSLKKLHHIILSSEAYQRGSSPTDLNLQNQIDPDNKLLSYFNPRRLAAEELRDAMLCISGELNREMGGIPVRPEINLEVALQPRHIMGSLAQAYQPSRTPSARNRRTIYTERIRSLENPFLSVFNQPRTELSCGHRSPSTVTPQVFALFNSEQIRNRALGLAQSLSRIYDHPEDQISWATREVWLRELDSNEVNLAFEYLKKMTLYHDENPITKKTPSH
ncbi:MAG: PSD1 domain-containing protein [Saprospiraceae bacterium]|nr:PSD1 domain-containing protein [Saprospiraceae bacterium]